MSENAIISGNTISDIGYVGILYREAGDRQTLTPNGSVIKDNTITKTGVQRNAGGYAIDITNTVVWRIILSGKIKLTIIVSKAPIANQNIKNPTVIISIIKQMPAIINHICHIKKPPIIHT